jgi:hypothetical protein
MPEPLSERPLFVVGAQRSGTTLVGALLARQPGLALLVNGKLAYYLAVWALANRAEAAARHVRLDEIAHGLARVPPRNGEPARFAAATDWLATTGELAACDDLAAGAARVWRRFHARLDPGAAVHGEKYNELLLHLDALDAMFPDCRIVFVHRDPLDAAESMVRHFAGRAWAPPTLEAALEKYLRWNRCWSARRARLAPERAYELAYEDLVARPAETLRACCAWLGLPYAPDAAAGVRIDPTRVGAGRRAGRGAVKAAAAAYAWRRSLRGAPSEALR